MPNMELPPLTDDDMLPIIASRIFEGGSLSPLEAAVVTVPLWVDLTSTAARGSAWFEIPTDYKFRIQSVKPVLVLDPVNETMANSGGALFNTGTVIDRIIAKLMNCRISLVVNPKSIQIFPQQSFPLYDLSSFASSGGVPRFFDTPLIVDEGQVVQMEAALQDTGAAGATTRYGVELTGALISKS